MIQRKIIVRNVKVHNLKSVDLELEPGQLILFTGVSGSGKSSLAFDTLYVEGQRRYIESLSAQARRQLNEMPKPDLEYAEGITPTISIEQKTAGRNPRSTVGTMTEIYDFLRVLYARIGIPHCPVSGEPVSPQSRERIIKTIQNLAPKTKLIVLAPFAKQKKGEFKEDFQDLLRKGFTRARVDGTIVQLENPPTLDGNVTHNIEVLIDRIVIGPENNSRIAEAVTNALQFKDGTCIIVDADKNEETFFSMHAYSPASGLSYSSLEPQDFSFNSASGMCPRCQGLGIINEYRLDLILDPKKSIAEDCFSIGSSYKTVRFGNIYDNLAKLYNFSVHTPWERLPEKAKKVFLYGTEKKWTKMHFVHPETGYTWVDNVNWRGIIYEAHSRYAEATSDSYRRRMEALMSEQVCPDCCGSRLKPYPAATLLNGVRIHELAAMTIGQCKVFFDDLILTPQEFMIAEELLKEIRERLHFLYDVGLHYLSLDRTAPTLSGGESQRVRLASQIGSGLVGITYILDEPSIGLHPRDNRRLISTLKHLRDIGNTVIVVEHDEETILEADHIVDFGPGPGSKGGQVVVDGSLYDLLTNKESLTGAYLTGKHSIPIPKKRRKKTKETIEIKGARHHNLKNINAEIPLGMLVAITGVSGSGKSSLISEILFPAASNALQKSSLPIGEHKSISGFDFLDKVISVDQTPIGRNPRSNPATYIKLFDDIRDLFAGLPESLARGYKPGRFSFNVKEGSCNRCEGMGMIKVDMDFMEDAWMECPVCKTKRFDHETLAIHFKGKNIYDVLEMEVDEAAEFFQNIPHILHKLQMLQKVGMGYIKIGQFSTTLSGGEAQRIKLAKELVRPSTGKTLYIFDEPTTGLHFHDIQHLMHVLQELVERGNTVVVIEHNMDVVKTADWIIDLGPDGGANGGTIIATGTPEKIASLDTPTGRALAITLDQTLLKQVNAIVEQGPTKARQTESKAITSITVSAAEQNNLKCLDVTIPRDKITVFTGPSGSGKTSLAFETIYAEGQRRYVESLSAYARQFVKQMPKPKVGKVDGLSPAIAIEQKAHAGNPRSTVGTMTEIYDYLRLLYARIGIPHDPETGEVIKSISKDLVVERVLDYPEGEKIQILAPIALQRNVALQDTIARLQRIGYLRIRFDGEYYDLTDTSFLQSYNKKQKHDLHLVIDRLKIQKGMQTRLYEAISTAAEMGEGKLIIDRPSGDVLFNLAFAVESTGKSFAPITPQSFAFNHADGMCLDCLGLGYQYGANLTQHSDIIHNTVTGLLHVLWPEEIPQLAWTLVQQFLNEEDIPWNTPLIKIKPEKLNLLMNGSPETYYTSPKGWKFRWRGLNNLLEKIGRSGVNELREIYTPLLDEHTCLSCKGARLNPLACAVTIQDVPIFELCAFPLKHALEFVKAITFSKADKKLMDEIKKQLVNRMSFLCEVGLHYLSLDRKAPTLSGGESQRIRLARQLGSGLTGVLYVLDEPTIGLHPRDNARLNNALLQLNKLGNTLLMVEHDPQTIASADYILDFGPGAGAQGGHITAKGTYKQLLRSSQSLTGQYLSGKKTIELKNKRHKADDRFLKVKNATANNLKNIDVSIPVGLFTCLTGVSGSGKSTLMHNVILPALKKGLLRSDNITLPQGEVSGIDYFDKVIDIDQNPIGLTSRSDVGTYVDVLSRMRDFFATIPLARTKGLKGKNFSYNHRKGMCTACWGMGYKKVEMHFLPAVKVPCEECNGLRLNPVSLEVTYKDKNFGQYLDCTVDQARQYFENHPRIVRILDTLIQVGLGYLKLGQEMATLSGGEAQRIKLSRELAKRSTGHTIYLLDEPTTGLHFDDIQKLVKVLQKLVDKGNTLLVIEHNIEFIKQADHIIDLGPDAGVEGGRVLCTGTPNEIAENENSWTGKYLKN